MCFALPLLPLQVGFAIDYAGTKNVPRWATVAFQMGPG